MPKEGEIWALKADPSKTLTISYVNSLGFVGYSNAHHMKRSYGTKALAAFLRSYRLA